MKDFNFSTKLSDTACPFEYVQSSCHSFVWLDNTHTKAIACAWGRFDAWCVYIIALNPSDNRWYAYPPKDVYYFERLYWLGTCNDIGLSLQKVYGHLQHLFELVRANPRMINATVLQYIDRVTSDHYGVYSELAREVFFLVYYGMIAEENRENTKLGALIKIHGLHELLICQKPVEIAANCTRGFSWRNIKAECDALGLIRYA